jgi:hypothetical protein
MRNFRQENYPSDPQFHEALQNYSLTEDDLKKHLLWQLATIRFTDLRFPAGVPGTPEQAADRLKSGTSSDPDPDDVDGKLEAWLKETRKGTKVQFKPGAFQ